jgi:hypothetical protein
MPCPEADDGAASHSHISQILVIRSQVVSLTLEADVLIQEMARGELPALAIVGETICFSHDVSERNIISSLEGSS